MGIKGLTKEIKKVAPSAIQTLTYKELADLSTCGCYGVDVYSYLYPTQYNVANKGKGNHIREFMEMIAMWAEHNIRLVFVFDGNTNSEAKRATIDQRNASRSSEHDNIQRIIDEIIQEEGLPEDAVSDDISVIGHTILRSNKGNAEQRIELEMALRTYIHVSKDKVKDLQTLFDLVGAKYVFARGEADFILAALYRNGYIDGVISEDCDMLTHGIHRLVRGLTDASLRRQGQLMVYSLPTVLEYMDLSMSQFIYYCILCGCDYCPKIDGVAGVTGLRLLKKYGSIPNIIEYIRKGVIKYRPSVDLDSYEFQYQRAYQIFNEEQEPLDPELLLTGEYIISDQCSEWILSETNYGKDTLQAKFNTIRNLQVKAQAQAQAQERIPVQAKIQVQAKAKIQVQAKAKVQVQAKAKVQVAKVKVQAKAKEAKV